MDNLNLKDKAGTMEYLLKTYGKLKGKRLVRLLELGEVKHSTIRAVTRIRDILWDNGVLVLADKDGYFLPEKPEDIEAYIISYKKKAITALVKLKKLEKLAYKVEQSKYDSLIDALGGADEIKKDVPQES